MAFAAIVGGHCLPYQWVCRTGIYGVLAIVVGPYLLAITAGRKAMRYTEFFVGAALLVEAWFVRRHARTTWAAHTERVSTMMPRA